MAQLYFRYGAMGCGKTMQLLQVAFNYEERGQKVCVIKPATDTKNGTKLLTRIGPERDTNFTVDRRTNIFNRIKKEYSDVDCVLVDESQFLTAKQVDQLMEVVIKLNIPVICYGLRTDFTGRAFPGSGRLLELADNLEEIPTICWCGHKARFEARVCDGKMVTEGEQVALGGNDMYISLCRKHFMNGDIGPAFVK